ncbi:MAG: ribokinase [Petrimonas sp.]|uniref:ribokinase n=1 Tax=Petrimonas sp. TaxID=2023866 RepID=UPI002B3A09F9|nr:ribokinase [Petrimonas sp.]
MSKIVVIGSSNTDLIAKIKDFPKAGETIKGVSYFQAMGGKGANQALAAHRLDGDVKFITSLGKDTNGLSTLEYYKKEGLDASLSLLVDDTPSGVAMIWVDEKGENSIVIISGANEMLSSGYIHEIKKEILKADLIVLQMEIPYDTVKTVCDVAYEHNKRVLLNVAPARKLNAEIIKKTHILIVNETEAEIISGERIHEIGEQAMVDNLLALGAKSVVLTLGSKGCIMRNESEYHKIPAFNVKSIDSTGAGDTFCGALAAGLTEGRNWKDSLIFASAASAICVTRLGAQPSIPTADEVYDFLKKNN